MTEFILCKSTLYFFLFHYVFILVVKKQGSACHGALVISVTRLVALMTIHSVTPSSSLVPKFLCFFLGCFLLHSVFQCFCFTVLPAAHRNFVPSKQQLLALVITFSWLQTSGRPELVLHCVWGPLSPSIVSVLAGQSYSEFGENLIGFFAHF